MSNPFSGSEIPGMNAMGDTLSFVKKLWGNMQVPGMVAPPMSVDELDKKIQDLKTVESWLTVNMNMLRGTIQALEVQRATLAALQSLGESFAQHAQQAGAMAGQAAADDTSKSSQNADWPMHPAASKATVPEPDPEEEVDEDVADMPPEAGADEAEAVTQAGETAAEPGGASAQFVNPAAWWGLLQDQFKQAVSKAMESEAAETAVTAATTTTTSVPVKKASKASPAKSIKATPAKPANKEAASKSPAKTTAKVAPKKTVAKPAVKAAKAIKI